MKRNSLPPFPGRDQTPPGKHNFEMMVIAGALVVALAILLGSALWQWIAG